MVWLYYLILFLFLLAGLAITVMTLPGLWLMLASAAVYAWITHGAFIGWWTLLILLILATTAELIEFLSSGAGAKRAGGGKAGLIGAIVGGILGGIFLSIIPIPILSTLVGVCLGTFFGAMVGEFAMGREITHSAVIGFGAAKGRLFGTMIKMGFGCVMLLITMGAGFPIHGYKTPPSTPVTIGPPTTSATH
jgi:hypothetical protein